MVQISGDENRQSISQKNMTTDLSVGGDENCPAEYLLKLLTGKWKPQLFKLAVAGPLRFNQLLRQLPGSNKQSLATALRELEESGVLIREVVKQKPLHIEYHLSVKGFVLIEVFEKLEGILEIKSVD